MRSASKVQAVRLLRSCSCEVWRCPIADFGHAALRSRSNSPSSCHCRHLASAKCLESASSGGAMTAPLLQTKPSISVDEDAAQQTPNRNPAPRLDRNKIVSGRATAFKRAFGSNGDGNDHEGEIGPDLEGRIKAPRCGRSVWTKRRGILRVTRTLCSWPLRCAGPESRTDAWFLAPFCSERWNAEAPFSTSRPLAFNEHRTAYVRGQLTETLLDPRPLASTPLLRSMQAFGR